jgi:hypothetical protein
LALSPDPISEGERISFFHHPAVQKSIEVNLKMIATYDVLFEDLERSILKPAQHHDPVSYALLQSVYGIRKIG